MRERACVCGGIGLVPRNSKYVFCSGICVKIYSANQ